MNHHSAPNLFDFDFYDSFSTGIPLSPQSDKENLHFSQQSSNAYETSSVSSESKKIRKKRNAYQKIDDNIRLELLDAVQKNGETLKSASKRLNINYSSAKSILHTYRKEGRILKKSGLERPISFFPFASLDLNIGSIDNQIMMKDSRKKQIGKLKNDWSFQFSQESPIVNLGDAELSTFNPMEGLPNIIQNNLDNSQQMGVDDFQNFQNQGNLSFTMTDKATSEILIEDSNPHSSLVPNLNLASHQISNPLDHLRHLDNFYMNYSNSPLSGGTANMIKDYSNPGSKSCNKKEFDSFTEMVNSLQSQTIFMDEVKNENQTSGSQKFNFLGSQKNLVKN